MEEEAGKLGLHISWVETKVQNLGYGAPASTVHINNEVVDAVTSFCHVGSTLTAGEKSSEEVRCRIGVTSSAVNRLDKLWSDRHMRNTTQFRIYSCCILSVLLYGCETWTLTSGDR